MKNVDLRHVETGLSEEERRKAIHECQRMRQRDQLGARWICHPQNAPEKGSYHPTTGARLV